MAVEITPLPTGATLEVGVDLAGTVTDVLASADRGLRSGDVLVVASKVVALSEGNVVDLPPGDPHAGRRRLAREQAVRVVADHPRVLVVETIHGLVCANAGIDTSNVAPGLAVLLPDDPDASAERLRRRLWDQTGADVGVVVTDTFGRPWRDGQVDVAIGAAGIAVTRDERHGHDLWGNTLDVTVAALADEVAAAADLVRRKDAAVPFVLVRGLDIAGTGGAADLVRPSELDLFPAGGPTMADHVVATARRLDDDTERSTVGMAGADAELAHVLTLAIDREVSVTVTDRSRHVVLAAGSSEPAGLLGVGASVARLEVLGAARGWTMRTVPRPDHAVEIHLDRPAP